MCSICSSPAEGYLQPNALLFYLMPHHEQNSLASKAEDLVFRLGRLSADSKWAHRASGVRAALDKALSQGEDEERLRRLMALGFDILAAAAREL